MILTGGSPRIKILDIELDKDYCLTPRHSKVWLMIRCTKTSALFRNNNCIITRKLLIFRASALQGHLHVIRMSSARIVAGLSSAVVRLSAFTFLRWVCFMTCDWTELKLIAITDTWASFPARHRRLTYHISDYDIRVLRWILREAKSRRSFSGCQWQWQESRGCR